MTSAPSPRSSGATSGGGSTKGGRCPNWRSSTAARGSSRRRSPRSNRSVCVTRRSAHWPSDRRRSISRTAASRCASPVPARRCACSSGSGTRRTGSPSRTTAGCGRAVRWPASCGRFPASARHGRRPCSSGSAACVPCARRRPSRSRRSQGSRKSWLDRSMPSSHADTVRTRFAPSPTGSLHVGNARVAVLNWLFAKKHNGVFILRIEDTDVERNVPGAEAEMIEDLLWLGLEWQEGPGVEGPYGEGPVGPYRQSQRGPLYRDTAAKLLESGAAFRCYCTEEELEAKRRAALARGETPRYDGTCRHLTAAEAARYEREGRQPAIRFRVPESGTIEVHDVVRGTVRFDASTLGDFVILRSDGQPTYNFAVVVDDLAMRITHVIRGV